MECKSNVGSDHYATFATLGGGKGEIINLTETKYNWKGMDATAFTKTLKHALHSNTDKYDEIFGPLKCNAATPNEINIATAFFQTCMTTVANRCVPRH